MSTADFEFESVISALQDSSWACHQEVVSGVETAVVVRRVARTGVVTPGCVVSLPGTDSRIGDARTSLKPSVTSVDTLKPKSPMGVQTGLAVPAVASVPGAAPAMGAVGDLATVRAMGSGMSAPVIGFDTEFTYLPDGVRRIDSYQFACFDPSDVNFRFDIVLLPLDVESRLAVEDCLAVVVREAGIWQSAGLPDARGVPRRSFWVTGDYRRSVAALYDRHRVSVVLAGHFLNADLTAFARPKSRRGDSRYSDVLRRVTSASGGLVSLKPIRMPTRTAGRGSGERWLPLSITVRDTMGQSAPGNKSLAALGEVCGVPKLSVGESISDMSRMRRENLPRFLEYGANDAVIVLEYLTALWGLDAVPPVTLSGGGAHALRAAIKDYWHIESTAEFAARFQGLVSVDDGQEACDDGLSYYAVRSLTPVDGDANQVHTAYKRAFHGGWNSCLHVGVFHQESFDHDIQSAYPTAMAALVDVDFETGVIEEVIKDRDLCLSDFPIGFVTPLVAYVGWEFPVGVEPCLPVRVGQSVVYPRTSRGVGAGQGEGIDAAKFEAFEGAWCCGPELRLALALGATVRVQIGYRLRVLEIDGAPSRSMRAAVAQMVTDRATARRVWGRGSLVEQTIKVATNSCYGKLAQDVSERVGWNAWEEEMESVGGSAVTSPYHAAMITSLVRALLLGIANEIPLWSVTTDGFITPVHNVEACSAFGLAAVFQDARTALVGDPTVWEIKHQQSTLVNLTTRGNVAPTAGGVLAKAGLKTPAAVARGSVEERAWFLDTAVSRIGKVANPYTAFPSFRELSRSENRLDFRLVARTPLISLDFDMKRQPLLDTMYTESVGGHEVAGFSTGPWDTVGEYARAREIARHIAAERPGTTGPNRPTGCLRTREEWDTWKRRYDASTGRRIRTAGSALLTELVAAHKAGLLDVPVLAGRASVADKLAWLSSLGYGHFTRAQWDHMSKQNRRDAVLKDADLSSLKGLVASLSRVVAA